ncbi:MAG TPA: transporter substrate-binding domain-containing protein, partial [Clostridiales bacterium]|nr:transporter substrate-binding domain-containing protein [Clostridiales bacterium]
LTQETYSLACQKGDEKFTEFLNSVIKDIKESGVYDELLEKYGLNE